jgi:SAM-dependent methyltransferase
MSRLPVEAFRRYDETPDEEFYETPRLVTHIDDRAIAAVTQLYKELFPAGGEVLDLMSSWVSHLPEEGRYRRVVGLGMNEEELKRNPRLDEYVVQNLNRTPELPFGEAEFDGVGICVSIDYLTNPMAVLREVGRVLKVGAPVVITFSNGCLPKRQLSWASPPLLASPLLRRVGLRAGRAACLRVRFRRHTVPSSSTLALSRNAP